MARCQKLMKETYRPDTSACTRYEHRLAEKARSVEDRHFASSDVCVMLVCGQECQSSSSQLGSGRGLT